MANPITIAQAEQSNSSSVWVLNSSGSSGRAKGNLHITIVEGNGRATVVTVPNTRIPVDLTTQATKNALMQSPDFRRCVAAKVLTLIDDKTAEKLLDNPDAQAEQRRLLNIDSAHQHETDIPELKALQAQESGKIGPFALNLAHTEDGDEDAIVANLKNNADNLSTEELQYVVNNSKFAKVKGAAAELVMRGA